MLKSTVTFNTPNEPIDRSEIDVWVNGTHRGTVGSPGAVSTYAVENLNHNDTVWVQASWYDMAGNKSIGPRHDFVAMDATPPEPPTVVGVVTEQV